LHVPQQTTWSASTLHFCGQIQRFIRNFWGLNNGSTVNNEVACYKLNNPSTLQVWQASIDYWCLISSFTVISRQALGSIWPTMYVKENLVQRKRMWEIYIHAPYAHSWCGLWAHRWCTGNHEKICAMYFICLGSWPPFHKISKNPPMTANFHSNLPHLTYCNNGDMLMVFAYRLLLQHCKPSMLAIWWEIRDKAKNKAWNTEFKEILKDSELQSYSHWSYLIHLIDYGAI
jgi:hypothetical protein